MMNSAGPPTKNDQRRHNGKKKKKDVSLSTLLIPNSWPQPAPPLTRWYIPSRIERRIPLVALARRIGRRSSSMHRTSHVHFPEDAELTKAGCSWFPCTTWGPWLEHRAWQWPRKPGVPELWYRWKSQRQEYLTFAEGPPENSIKR